MIPRFLEQNLSITVLAWFVLSLAVSLTGIYIAFETCKLL